MIIRGNGKKALEISNWLVKEHGLKPPQDYRWHMLAFSNNTKIKFEFRDASMESLVALRFANDKGN